jgi:hypothetical protein
VIEDPEEEAWMEIEKKQFDRVPVLFRQTRIKSFDEAFDDYIRNPGAPRTAGDEEVRRHFNAGWVAAIRNEWARERND